MTEVECGMIQNQDENKKEWPQYVKILALLTCVLGIICAVLQFYSLPAPFWPRAIQLLGTTVAEVLLMGVVFRTCTKKGRELVIPLCTKLILILITAQFGTYITGLFHVWFLGFTFSLNDIVLFIALIIETCFICSKTKELRNAAMVLLGLFFFFTLLCVLRDLREISSFHGEEMSIWMAETFGDIVRILFPLTFFLMNLTLEIEKKEMKPIMQTYTAQKTNGDVSFCPKCGARYPYGIKFCGQCGGPLSELIQPDVEMRTDYYNSVSMEGKDWLTTLLLCLFAGGLGIHRFYVGKTGTGLLYLLTLGCLGIGSLIDLITIVTGSFTDVNGRPLVRR